MGLGRQDSSHLALLGKAHIPTSVSRQFHPSYSTNHLLLQAVTPDADLPPCCPAQLQMACLHLGAPQVQIQAHHLQWGQGPRRRAADGTGRTLRFRPRETCFSLYKPSVQVWHLAGAQHMEKLSKCQPSL